VYVSNRAGNAALGPTRAQRQAEGGCETTWLWGLCRDERGWNKEAEPAVYFEHDASRGGHVAERMLEGALIDTLQIDGWKAYNRIRRVPGQNDGVEIARCMAHARRKFTNRGRKSGFIGPMHRLRSCSRQPSCSGCETQ